MRGLGKAMYFFVHAILFLGVVICSIATSGRKMCSTAKIQHHAAAYAAFWESLCGIRLYWGQH